MSVSDSGRLVILSAPSGAGKTTLARRVMQELDKEGLKAGFSVSYTTRAPRPGEQDGRDYHFVERAQFEQMVAQDAMLEHAEVFGRCYGTGLQATQQALARGEVVFLDIDWQGARQIKQRLPEQTVSVFVLPPSKEALLQRLRGRGQDSEDLIQGRMREAVSEMSHYNEFEYVLVNDDLEQTVGQLKALCMGEPVSACHAQDHALLLQGLLESA